MKVIVEHAYIPAEHMALRMEKVHRIIAAALERKLASSELRADAPARSQKKTDPPFGISPTELAASQLLKSVQRRKEKVAA